MATLVFLWSAILSAYLRSLGSVQRCDSGYLQQDIEFTYRHTFDQQIFAV